MSANINYLITVLRCEESGMLVGHSSDIPGLNVEARTPHDLVEAIAEVAPSLMRSNLKLSDQQIMECSISVAFRREPAPAPRRPRPDIFVHSDLVAAPA